MNRPRGRRLCVPAPLAQRSIKAASSRASERWRRVSLASRSHQTLAAQLNGKRQQRLVGDNLKQKYLTDDEERAVVEFIIRNQFDTGQATTMEFLKDRVKNIMVEKGDPIQSTDGKPSASWCTKFVTRHSARLKSVICGITHGARALQLPLDPALGMCCMLRGCGCLHPIHRLNIWKPLICNAHCVTLHVHARRAANPKKLSKTRNVSTPPNTIAGWFQFLLMTVATHLYKRIWNFDETMVTGERDPAHRGKRVIVVRDVAPPTMPVDTYRKRQRAEKKEQKKAEEEIKKQKRAEKAAAAAAKKKEEEAQKEARKQKRLKAAEEKAAAKAAAEAAKKQKNAQAASTKRKAKAAGGAQKKKRKNGAAIFCKCQQPYDEEGGDMLGCEKESECRWGGWVHPACIGMTKAAKDAAKKDKKWKCPMCVCGM